MSDYKNGYSTNASKMKQNAETSKALAKIKISSRTRANLYKDNWTKVNINDVIEKFTPGATPYNKGGKFIYSNDRYSIITDTFGGYLRIEDKSIKAKYKYITLEGKSYYDLPKSEREKLTHFYILKREDM